MPAQLNQTAKSKLPSLMHCATHAPTVLRESDRRMTIHRRTSSHHGRALEILGHASEQLSAQLVFEIDPREEAAMRQALHILMHLSRSVFDDYAEQTRRERPVTDWLMRQAIRVYGAA